MYTKLQVRRINLPLASTDVTNARITALMEYHATKTADVSTKIFELGMKQFATDVDFIVRYLGFLISINDDTSE